MLCPIQISTMATVKIEGSSPSVSEPFISTTPNERMMTKKRPGFSNTGQLITLIAHERETPFVIHKDFACHYSPVLSAALNGTLVEGKTQTYRFRIATAETIQFLVHWLYNQDFSVEREGPGGKNPHLVAYWRFPTLVRLWIVAAELKMPSLQNQIIRELETLRTKHGCHGTRLYPFVYENTQKGSPLRKYMAHAALNLAPRFVEENIEVFPKAMLHDMTVLFMVDKQCREKVLNPVDDEKKMAQYQVPEDGNC